jgi:hypothetical protein
MRVLQSFDALLAGLAGRHGELFLNGFQTSKNFRQAQRHIKDGFGLRQNMGWQTRFEGEELGIAKY